MDDNIKVEKQYIQLQGLVVNAKNIPILFVCLSITSTYIYKTFDQVHIVPIVAWYAEQTQFGKILNTKGYRTHKLLDSIQ